MIAVRCGPGTCRMDDRSPSPEPRPGEAAVRPTRLAATPDLLEVPSVEASGGGLIPGHAFVGVIEASGSREDAEVSGRGPGARVIGPRQIVCGACDLCRAGLSEHCRSSQRIGIDRDGCLAERVVLPTRSLIPVPDGIDDDEAVFAHDVARALHVSQRIRVDAKVYVTVLGDSPGALLASQVMARLNASVRCLGKRPACYGLCEKWGVKHRHTDEVGRRADQDVVIECTGTPTGLALAFELVRPRGTIVLMPGDEPAPGERSATIGPVTAGELELIGVASGDLGEALSTLANSGLDVVSLITRREPLARADAALFASRDPDQLRVLIEN